MSWFIPKIGCSYTQNIARYDQRSWRGHWYTLRRIDPCRKLREPSLHSSWSAEQNPTVTAKIGCWIREITPHNDVACGSLSCAYGWKLVFNRWLRKNYWSDRKNNYIFGILVKFWVGKTTCWYIYESIWLKIWQNCKSWGWNFAQ